jgi:hypothetical protein
MRKDWKYILYISLAFGLFVGVKLLSPKEYNWAITFAHNDKNPFGAYAYSELLPGIFPDKKIDHSYKTLYELKDSLSPADNVVIVSSVFNADKEDTNVLLEHVEKGATAFISAEYFRGYFADSIAVSTYDYFFKVGNIFDNQDSAYLKFANMRLDTLKEFYYRRNNIHNYFNEFDSTRTTVIAKNDYGYPVTIRIAVGKGNLILNSTPLMFTNIYLLSENNDEFIAGTLSFLPAEDVTWTEYYHVGRMEASTPLRFILTNEPLRWAYYITIISTLIFMAFELKRRQRIIPVIKPLDNSTLDFVTTIGNLYLQSGDHKNMAEKKIQFFMDQIRSKYLLNTSVLDESFTKTLSKKTGKNELETSDLINTIKTVRSRKEISAGDLTELNKKMEKFLGVI